MTEVAERVRIPEATDVEKVTVRLSGDALNLVRRLAAKEGISVNEFIRRAVSTEAYFLEETQKGSKIMIEGSDNRLKQVVFR